MKSKFLNRSFGIAILSVIGASLASLLGAGLAAVVTPFDPDWDAAKTYTVVGSAALLVGAFLQAWRDSANAPAPDAKRDALSLAGWSLVCSGALFVLVGAIAT